MLLYGGILYVVETASGGTRTIVERINPSSMLSMDITNVAGITGPIGTCITTDGTYVYVGCNIGAALNNYLYQIPISNGFGGGGGTILTCDLTSIGNIAYAIYINAPTNEIYVAVDSKVAYLSLSLFTLTGSFSVAAHVNQFSASNYADTLLATIQSSPGKLSAISFAAHNVISSLTFAAGENNPTGIVYDGTYVWVAFATTPTLFKKITGDGAIILYSFTAPAGQISNAGIVLVGGSPFVLTVSATAYIIILNSSGFSYQVCDGTTALQFQEMISAGAIPKRAAAIRHYLSTNGVDFYLIKEVSLLAGVGAVSWGASAVYDASTKHFYHQSGLITINSDDQNTIGALAQVILGRDPYDQGAYPFLVGVVAGKETFIGNVLINGVPILNSGIVCAVGSEAIMNDVFPNDAASIIDLEYSDGDQIRAILALGERALYLKRRNTVLVSYNEQTQGYDRDIADRGHGCCSQRACNVYGETAFYMDSYNARSFNTGSGGQGINDDWILGWQALTETQKGQTISIIDIENRQWLVSLSTAAGGKTYMMDLDTGEWVSLLLTDTPTQFADNAPVDSYFGGAGFTGTIDFLSGGNIMEFGIGTLHNNVGFLMQWRSNRIEGLLGAEGYGYDLLPEFLMIRYSVTVISIGVNIYLDDNSTPLNPTPYLLSPSNIEALIGLPLGARCKAISVEFLATTTGWNQTIQIQMARLTFDKTIQGGDLVSFSS